MQHTVCCITLSRQCEFFNLLKWNYSKAYMEETGEAYFDVDFDLNDDEYMEEVMGRFRAANAGQGSII